MAITVTLVQPSDPRYNPDLALYEVAGTLSGGPVYGMQLPYVTTLPMAQQFLKRLTDAQADEIAKYAAPIAAGNEVLAALKAAGAQ